MTRTEWGNVRSWRKPPAPIQPLQPRIRYTADGKTVGPGDTVWVYREGEFEAVSVLGSLAGGPVYPACSPERKFYSTREECVAGTLLDLIKQRHDIEKELGRIWKREGL